VPDDEYDHDSQWLKPDSKPRTPVREIMIFLHSNGGFEQPDCGTARPTAHPE
jgi:hypothetical protein